jgi:biopolymer transport protein ExbD
MVSTDTNQAGENCTFGSEWIDEFLDPNGQYIFSFDNCTGHFINDTPMNFTTTPQTVSSAKILNSTVGCTIKYTWYAKDNAGNLGKSGVYSFNTTAPIIYPIVTLLSPENGSFSPFQNVSFRCQGYDPVNGLKNVTLYGNWSGSWQPNGSLVASGWWSMYIATLNRNIPNGTHKWNCRFCNRNNNCSYASSNFTFKIGIGGDTPPTVSLQSPSNGLQTNNTIVLFRCNAIDDKKVQNLSLWTNITGSWARFYTNTSCNSATCYLTNTTTLTMNKTYKWNCLSYDNSSQLDWADQNWTLILTETPQQTCQGGLPYGSCSDNKPYYCDQGTLIKNCSVCNCSSGTCQTDGSCKTSGGGGGGGGGGCINGNKQCSGNSLQECQNTKWITIENCSYICNSSSLSCQNALVNINNTNQKNQTILCNEGQKKCENNKLLTCQDNAWTSQDCIQGCQNNECIQIEKPKTNFLIYIIAAIVILAIIIILIIILTRKKVSPVYTPVQSTQPYQSQEEQPEPQVQQGIEEQEQVQETKEETDLTKLVREVKKLDKGKPKKLKRKTKQRRKKR